MKRIELKELVNQYPTIESYVKHSDDTIRLEGVYSEKNVIYFKIKPVGSISIDSIQTIEGTSFQFILAITNGDSMATNAKLYTSPSYKLELQKSLLELNPYFIRDSLKYPFIVHYPLTNSRKLVNNLAMGKTPDGKDIKDANGKVMNGTEFVTMNKYHYIDRSGNVDYTKLVKYIDWVVSTPIAISELDTNNVLPINKLLSQDDYTKTPFTVQLIPPVDSTSPDSYQWQDFGGSTGGGGTATGGSNNGAGGDGNGTGVSGGNPADTTNPNDNTPDTGVGAKGGYQL